MKPGFTRQESRRGFDLPDLSGPAPLDLAFTLLLGALAIAGTVLCGGYLLGAF